MTPYQHLTEIGHICPSPAFEQLQHVSAHGQTKEQLYTFVSFSEDTKVIVMTAPARNAKDFSNRYYSQIIKK